MNSTSNENLYENIERRHGRATLQRVKRLKRQGIKVARLESKFEFLLNCKKNNVVPKTLHIRAPKCIHPADAARLERTLSRITLNNAINRDRKERQWARNDYKQFQPRVKSELTPQEYSAVCRAIRQKDKAVRASEGLHKENKLAAIIDFNFNVNPEQVREQSTTHETDRVINLTNVEFNDTQHTLLGRHLKFGLAPDRVPTIEIVHAVESAATFLPIIEATQLKMQIAKVLNKECKVKKNFTPEELSQLKKLKSEKNLIFLTADKGGATVIMEKSTYVAKLMEIVQSDAYEKTEVRDLPRKVSIALRKLCAELLKCKVSKEKKAEEKTKVKKQVSKEINKFKPGAEEPFKTPHLYGAPKEHKEGTPLRPIVSTIGSILRDTENFLKPLLALATRNSKYNIKNSMAALNALKELQVDENTRLCSFDVKNMFPSIPRGELLIILRKKLEKNKKLLKEHTCLTPAEIVNLVKFTLENTFFELEGEIYVQKSGLAMGSPISPLLADIFMEDFLEKLFKTLKIQPQLFLKYVDDCICVYNSKNINEQNLLEQLNSKSKHIQFTIEKEEQNSLPFLDIHIHRNTEKLTFTVYRKPTDKGILLNYNSNHSFATKATVVRAGIHRAYEYCEKGKDRKAEIRKTYQILYKNDYPHHFIAKVHQKVKNCHLKKLQNLRAAQNLSNIVNDGANVGNSSNITASKPGFKSCLNIPYVRGISESIQKIVKKCCGDKLRVVYSCKNTLRKMLSHVKPKQKPLLKNCVYKIECECKAKYIGQTTRALKTRVKEHKDAQNKIQDENNKNHNRLALHVQKTKHKVDFDNVSVIHFENKWNKRLVAESMAMIASENVISQSSRNIDKIFWKNIKVDGKKERGKKYFCEKARLNDVSDGAQQTPHTQPRPPQDAAQSATAAGRAQRTTNFRPAAKHMHAPPPPPLRPACSYFLRTRTRGSPGESAQDVS
jgi:predicted GIY-YIG superfamily endonuclease